ncbi:unnamed protein product [Thlaspi arvense]|uniref:Uncharacterized protein n=1 Tax=Thlaspi arvense TaxID=13288 RepID=A0AAU9RSG3_THLAR|nr:unnamed protein product [Thlaspi arvense]
MVTGSSRIIKEKTIHVLNKNEHALDMAAPVHDHLGDVDGSICDNMSVKKRTKCSASRGQTLQGGNGGGRGYEEDA